LRAVSVSLGILVTTAATQSIVFLTSGSVALLGDLIHNVGDALTAVPVGDRVLASVD
jgi:divalent metal cation (Fe/Co/Zn/Cd) transporter